MTTRARVAVAAVGMGLLFGASDAHGQGGPPLAPFASQKLSVLPVQLLRADTTTPLRPAQWAAVRTELDDSIGTALRERGLGNKWAYPTDIVRMARRNAAYVSDPYALGAGSLRGRALKPDEPAPAIVINNLRPLVALGDSRYAMVPVELAFEGRGADATAIVRVVLLDARGGTVMWAIDVAVKTGAAFGAAEAGVVAQRIADLVIAR